MKSFNWIGESAVVGGLEIVILNTGRIACGHSLLLPEPKDHQS